MNYSKLYLFTSAIFFILIFNFRLSFSLDSIFTTPDVFITSKLKPSKDYESDRGNLLHDSHDCKCISFVRHLK